MKVTVKGKEYNFEFESVWGPMYTYEEVTQGKLPFTPSKTLCLHILFWCILLRANPGGIMDLEEFLVCLNDLDLAAKLMDYYRKRMLVLSETTEPVEAETEEEGKKKD